MKILLVFLSVLLVACGGDSEVAKGNSDVTKENVSSSDYEELDIDISNYTDLIAGRQLNKNSLKGTWAVTTETLGEHGMGDKVYTKKRGVVKVFSHTSTNESSSEVIPHVYLSSVIENGKEVNKISMYNENLELIEIANANGNRISIEYIREYNGGDGILTAKFEMAKLSDDLLDFGYISNLAQSSEVLIEEISLINYFVEEEIKSISSGEESMASIIKITADNGSHLWMYAIPTERENKGSYLLHLLPNKHRIDSREADFLMPQPLITTSTGSNTAVNSVYTSTVSYSYNLNLWRHDIDYDVDISC